MLKRDRTRCVSPLLSLVTLDKKVLSFVSTGKQKSSADPRNSTVAYASHYDYSVLYRSVFSFAIRLHIDERVWYYKSLQRSVEGTSV